MTGPITLHTCEVRSWEGDTGELPIEFEELPLCGKPATLHTIGDRSYWMCDEHASGSWTPPLGS